MDFYYNAPVWNDEHCPHTFPTAQPRQAIEVNKVTVIEVRDGGAFYRGSNFSGRFVVANTASIPMVGEGNYRIPIYCLWFGHRLVSRQKPKFSVDMARCEVIEGFTGMVDMNLAR